MEWHDVFWRAVFGLIALACSWYFIREYYRRDRDRWRRRAEQLVARAAVAEVKPGNHARVLAKARRCIELIEAERKPRVGNLQYENACNHAINAICREFDIEEATNDS